jgi:hypothetical protein
LRCEHPQEHVETPPRYIERMNVHNRKRIPGCTIRHDDDGERLSGADINLGLLIVCRQIYQEAVLKPFSEIPFYHIIHWTDKVPGLEGFVDDLAPPQLRAFKRMRIVLEHVYLGENTEDCRCLKFGWLLEKKDMRKFTGLKDLEIVLNPQLWDEERGAEYLSHLDTHFVPDHNSYYSQSMGWLQALPELRMKSLRVTVEAEYGEYAMYERSRLFPTFTSRNEVEMIKKWLRQTELDLHFGEKAVTVRDRVPFGVKQDDDAIGVPPWATAEALKAFGLAIPEESEDEDSSHSLTDTSDPESDNS